MYLKITQHLSEHNLTRHTAIFGPCPEQTQPGDLHPIHWGRSHVFVS